MKDELALVDLVRRISYLPVRRLEDDNQAESLGIDLKMLIEKIVRDEIDASKEQ